METIIFDVDDTLYDQTLPFKKAFRELIEESVSEEKLERIYLISRKHSDALFDKNLAGEISVRDMHIQRVTLACEEFGYHITDETALKFQDLYVANQKEITLYKEVQELLDLLHSQKRQLAVLTNGEEAHQSMKINQLNLTNWIPQENIFISGSVGHAKPAIEVFEHLEEKLQLDKAKTVYIGDTFANDVVGAKQAGWQAIWTNHRKRDIPDSPFQPDKTVYDAKELLELFQNESSLQK